MLEFNLQYNKLQRNWCNNNTTGRLIIDRWKPGTLGWVSISLLASFNQPGYKDVRARVIKSILRLFRFIVTPASQLKLHLKLAIVYRPLVCLSDTFCFLLKTGNASTSEVSMHNSMMITITQIICNQNRMIYFAPSVCLSVFCRWLVVLRIYVASAVFQPYYDLEAGDNQSLKIQVARLGIEPRSFCFASLELNHSAIAAPSLFIVNFNLSCRFWTITDWEFIFSMHISPHGRWPCDLG